MHKPYALFRTTLFASASPAARSRSAASMAPVAAEHGMVVTAQHLATRRSASTC